jgi:DNA modification methylase
MCGDSTDAGSVALLMDGEKADMVFTDPPYGMKLDTDYTTSKKNLQCSFMKEKHLTGGKCYPPVIGDNEDFSPALINTVFENFGYCKEIFMFGADYYAELLLERNAGSWIVWDKRIDENADKMQGSCFELCWSKAKHKREIARVKWVYIFGTEKEFDHQRHHPTQKPIDLVLWFFERYAGKNCSVVDLYGGSGSTLIACEKTGRSCRMMELSEHYVDVIIRRWQDFTGDTATLEGDGRTFAEVAQERG